MTHKVIVIQSADKGGALVILDRSAYNREAMRQLSNSLFYCKLQGNPITDFKTKVHDCLNELLKKGEITKDECTFMLVNSPVTPVFYTLPRIHKDYVVQDKLNEFHHFMNTQNSHLNFTMSHDQHKMNFLDILVINNHNGLSTSLYRKPTDRNSKSLPIAQFHRVCRICCSDKDFKEKATDLKDRFLMRGYKKEWVTQASNRFAESTQANSSLQKLKILLSIIF